MSVAEVLAAMNASKVMALSCARSNVQKALFDEYDDLGLEARGIDRLEWLEMTQRVMDRVDPR